MKRRISEKKKQNSIVSKTKLDMSLKFSFSRSLSLFFYFLNYTLAGSTVFAVAIHSFVVIIIFNIFFL